MQLRYIIELETNNNATFKRKFDLHFSADINLNRWTIHQCVIDSTCKKKNLPCDVQNT